MTERPVPEGALFYAETRRRMIVPINASLRSLTEATVERLRTIYLTEKTPPAVYCADRCRACSLIELCRPRAVGRSAIAYRDAAIRGALGDAAAP